MLTLIQTFLVIHLCGFALLSGITLMHYNITRQVFINKHASSSLIKDLLSIVTKLTMFAGMATVVSGVTLVIIFKGTVVTQLWFIIKITLVIIIIFNGSIVGGRQTRNLQNLLTEITSAGNIELITIHQKLRIYFRLQFLLVTVVVILSVFRFI